MTTNLTTMNQGQAALMEQHERTAAYDSGAWAAQHPDGRAAVPNGCPFPEDWIDGFCDELQARIDRAKGRTS